MDAASARGVELLDLLLVTRYAGHNMGHESKSDSTLDAPGEVVREAEPEPELELELELERAFVFACGCIEGESILCTADILCEILLTI